MLALPAPHPFEALTPHAYDLVMIDAPWPMKMRSPKGEAKSFARHYGAMSFEAIAALPIGALLKRDAVVFLWCTSPLLLHGGDPDRHYAGADAGRSRQGECLQAWGLRYVGQGTWVKLTKTGKLGFGTGYRLRSAGEPWLIGIKGSPWTSRRERNVILGAAREHSRKPEEAFAWCERYMYRVPDARFLELFSRKTRPGWDTWGHQRGKFDPVVARNAPALEAAA